MRLSLLSILFLLCIKISGQSIEEIRRLLDKKELNPLKEYIISSSRPAFSMGWEILRDVVDDNQEGVIKITVIKERDSIGNVDNYSINLLAHRSRIFFYEFLHWKFKDNGYHEYKSSPAPVANFIDSSAYNNFQTDFQNTYSTALDKNDLFETSIVYGSSCGILGTPADDQIIIDSLLSVNDRKTISGWLRSANAEKQLYAIQGLSRLDKNGYLLTPEDARIIEVIKKKKGFVKTCSGCIFFPDDIKSAVVQAESSDLPIKRSDKRFNNLAIQSTRKKSNNNFYIGIVGLLAIVVLILIRKKPL